MIFTETRLKGSYTIELELLKDVRGAFARTYCKNEFQQIGHQKGFVQMNQSFNHRKGTVRGMHYQVPPYGEIKLIRCIKGAVLDVVVDLRKGSETFLESIQVELSESNHQMIYIPEGFAHGFQTLTDDAQLVYSHTEFYAPQAEAGLNYQDPMLKLEWPLDVSVISEKDQQYPFLEPNFQGI